LIIKSEKEIENIYQSFKSELEIFYKKRIDSSYAMLDSDYGDLAKKFCEYFSALYIDTPWFDYINLIAAEILYRPVYLAALLEKAWTKKEAKEFASTNFIITNEQISFNNEIVKG
jgi:hypothetical protein